VSCLRCLLHTFRLAAPCLGTLLYLVGAPVGMRLGSLEGAGVGTLEGWAVGTRVGRRVGERVGRDLGGRGRSAERLP
jgi:hypothetical protein